MLIDWSERNPGHGVPKWLRLSALPFVLAMLSMEDPYEHLLGEAGHRFGDWAILLAGFAGTTFGIAALALRGSDSLIGLLWWVLPAGLIVTIFSVVRALNP